MAEAERRRLGVLVVLEVVVVMGPVQVVQGTRQARRQARVITEAQEARKAGLMAQAEAGDHLPLEVMVLVQAAAMAARVLRQQFLVLL
jgi:hypothetical protein